MIDGILEFIKHNDLTVYWILLCSLVGIMFFIFVILEIRRRKKYENKNNNTNK